MKPEIRIYDTDLFDTDRREKCQRNTGLEMFLTSLYSLHGWWMEWTKLSEIVLRVREERRTVITTVIFTFVIILPGRRLFCYIQNEGNIRANRWMRVPLSCSSYVHRPQLTVSGMNQSSNIERKLKWSYHHSFVRISITKYIRYLRWIRRGNRIYICAEKDNERFSFWICPYLFEPRWCRPACLSSTSYRHVGRIFRSLVCACCTSQESELILDNKPGRP